MNVTKLTWAGVHVEYQGSAVLIDPIASINEKFGPPREPFFPLPEAERVDAVLITHTHRDHFDPESVMKAYGDGVPILVPAASAQEVRKAGFRQVKGLGAGETEVVGSLEVTATHSVDGYASPQAAWVVQGGGKKLIHCGDTLWHGYWWMIQHQFGAFDLACLPINGAVLTFSRLVSVDEPACMTPEQAVSAALVLQAKRLLPIHYGTFHHPPVYMETPNALERLAATASTKQVDVCALQPGESLLLA